MMSYENVLAELLCFLPYTDIPAFLVALLVNMEREKHGLSTLLYSDKLGEMAQLRANEILTPFGHTRPDGRSCFGVVDEL